MIIAAASGFVLLICMLACCCCKSSSQNKVEIIENNRVVETSPREIELGDKPGAGNDTSVELEDVDDDEVGEHGEASDINPNNVYHNKGNSGTKDKNDD